MPEEEFTWKILRSLATISTGVKWMFGWTKPPDSIALPSKTLTRQAPVNLGGQSPL